MENLAQRSFDKFFIGQLPILPQSAEIHSFSKNRPWLSANKPITHLPYRFRIYLHLTFI